MNTVSRTSAMTACLPGRVPTASRCNLETARLTLRLPEANDLPGYFALFSDAAVMRMVGLEAGKTLNCTESKAILDGAVKAWNTRGYGRWSMFDRQTGEFVGFCGFRSERGFPELICMMHERFWGSGRGVEAAEACLEFGFATLGFAEVRVYCRPEHRQARKLLEKLNAHFLGFVDFHGVEGLCFNILRPA